MDVGRVLSINPGNLFHLIMIFFPALSSWSALDTLQRREATPKNKVEFYEQFLAFNIRSMCGVRPLGEFDEVGQNNYYFLITKNKIQCVVRN